MGNCDKAEGCKMVGLLLLNNLANEFDKNGVGLYRDDRLFIFKNINGYCADKICKEFNQLFNENRHLRNKQK